MPQPFSRIVRNAHIYLDPTVLADKPEMAVLVTKIFATWTHIESSLGSLLMKILGADAAPALAIYSRLNTQGLQMVALEAAAKAALSDDDFDIFKATLSATDSAQKPRNHLAHWVWGGCKQRPDLLALADPKMIKERDHRAIRFMSSVDPTAPPHPDDIFNAYNFNPEMVLAYSKEDLERALRDLTEANETVALFDVFIDQKLERSVIKIFTAYSPDYVRARALEQLGHLRLFREALSLIRASRKTDLPTHDGSPPLAPPAS